MGRGTLDGSRPGIAHIDKNGVLRYTLTTSNAFRLDRECALYIMGKCELRTTLLTGVLLVGSLFLSAAGAYAHDFGSIQLVGNFEGITCEPDDAANNMDPIGDNVWRKLKLINEPGDPDTIYFKFTADGSYLPLHWGWSFDEGWGIADYDWSLPSIVAVLPDSGYWYFSFNDSTYEYWLDRPDAIIEGTLESDQPGVPPGAIVSLSSAIDGHVISCSQFSGKTFDFQNLPEGEFTIQASAPGYRNAEVTGIMTSSGEPEQVSLELVPVTAVQVTTAECERVDGGVVLSWVAYCCGEMTGFDIYRSDSPDLTSAVRRNAEPIYGITSFSWFDECNDPLVDRYYWLIELDSDDPTIVGPMLAAGLPGVPSSLGQNYPNPFNPATSIPFTVGSAESGSRVTMVFYDVSGRTVARYDLGNRSAGDHTYVWNPALSSGRSIPSGVYYCRLQIGKEALTRKMILLR